MVRNFILLLISLIIISESAVAQKFLSQKFYDTYDVYKENHLSERRFKHKHVQNLLEDLKSNKNFEIEQIGTSLDGRSINMVKYGTGKIKVLAWSQMHGDEPTATMALFDIFNFLAADDEFNNFRKKLKSKITLYIIPMLNPDGAEKYERENSLFIDLNRDALRLQSPEAKALKSVRDKIEPQFGFNLHDQLTRYAAGKNFKQATISFLAPPYNHEREINKVRENTMKLIVNMHDELVKYIPGHIGKWSDEFEPRAFGDNMVKWGTSSVLIESGGWMDDSEKQFVRKLNFIALLNGFHSIADGIYKKADIKTYEAIPENNKLIYDLVLSKISYKYKGNNYILDIAIQHNEKGIGTSNKFYYSSSIEDIGDLSVFYGLSEIDCEDYLLVPGKTSPEKYKSLDEVKELDFIQLYKKGYTSVVVENLKQEIKFTSLPINIYRSKETKPKFGLEENPEFVIKHNGKVKFVVINGFVYDIESNHNTIKNGLILGCNY